MQFKQVIGMLIFAAGIAAFVFALALGDRGFQEIFLFASAVWVAVLIGLTLWLI